MSSVRTDNLETELFMREAKTVFNCITGMEAKRLQISNETK